MINRFGRRDFTKVAFFGSLLALATAGVAAVANMLYPRDPVGGDEIVVARARVPAPGDPPLYVADGRFLLVNLLPSDGTGVDGGIKSPGGLLALHVKCPHLGCGVEWPDTHSQVGQRLRDAERIVCTCHWSTFSAAGVRVFGPTPRSLDTLPLRVTAQGDVMVDPLHVRTGSMQNGLYAVPWAPDA